MLLVVPGFMNYSNSFENTDSALYDFRALLQMKQAENFLCIESVWEVEEKWLNFHLD